MTEKTYHIQGYSEEKARVILHEVAATDDYLHASSVLLLVFEQNWDESIIQTKSRLYKSVLPKVTVVGITHFDKIQDVMPHNCVLTFLFFTTARFAAVPLSLVEQTDEEVNAALHRVIDDLSEKAPVQCIMTLFQKFHRDVEVILGGIDIPTFGADAGLSTLLGESGISYVFLDDTVYTQTLLAVFFLGTDLHVKVSYNLGWIPVGKTLTVTGMRDPYHVTEIDYHPAAEIYEHYLGIDYKSNQLYTLNNSEFPLTVTHGGMTLGRIPFAWTPEGDLQFAIPIREGEPLRIAYSLPDQIFSQIGENVTQYERFEPQAMLLVVCLNRVIFLKDMEHLEVDLYRAVAPNTAILHGNAEVCNGHELHSALIAVGFREGPMTGEMRYDLSQLLHTCHPQRTDPFLIPLEYRLMTFLRAVTADLEHTTLELLDLQRNLEQEVVRKTRENNSLSIHVVQTLAEAIDAKDTYTKGHSGRVAAYSREIAKRAGFSLQDQNDIYMMGLLHDVGKIGVPDAVINKPGKLTQEEYEKIRAHPVMGARILQTIQEMPKLVTGARWHHERFDGRGYPDGLKGTEIPVEARIICVADAYDAMTSNRSYRDVMPQEKVRSQILKGRGTQFDPRFADILLEMIDEDTHYDMREKHEIN